MKPINYQTYKKPSDYVKLEDGHNRIKILTQGVTCYEHSLVMNKKFIPMGICSENTDCEQCKKGNLPKLKYKWIVYVIGTKETQLLSVGPEAGDQICQIGLDAQEKPEAGNIFEINISRSFSGGRYRYQVSRVQSNTVDLETAKIIKQRRDYLALKYLNI